VRFEGFSFGEIRIDGRTYSHDVVVDRGEVRQRKKGPSKRFRDDLGHTPVSLKERIPWRCKRLVIGTGEGGLPVMDQVRAEARRRKVQLIVLPTARAILALRRHRRDTNAILHVTC
jgi:hypothetical protein